MSIYIILNEFNRLLSRSYHVESVGFRSFIISKFKRGSSPHQRIIYLSLDRDIVNCFYYHNCNRIEVKINICNPNCFDYIVNYINNEISINNPNSFHSIVDWLDENSKIKSL